MGLRPDCLDSRRWCTEAYDRRYCLMAVNGVVIITPERETVWRFLSPFRLLLNLWNARHLIRQFALRDVVGRYKGSRLGLLWSIANPLLMLSIYTFVFSVVFKSRWGVDASDSRCGFALTMFCGMLVFNVFSESANRAPTLMLCSVNYVKKVVFPLEILPVSVVFSCLVFACINILILLLASAILLHSFSWTVFCIPLVLLPITLLALGVGWFLASLGVYLRDLGHIIGVILQVLFFMTPLFYPVSAVPAQFQPLLQLNPLTTIVESARNVLMWSMWPNWYWLAIVTLMSAVIAQLGYAWFMKTKRGFADVI